MSYKILHTSDWHLGKKLFKKDRIEEQKLFLQWLIEYIQTNHIDLLLIAGDIFDSPNPPHSAIQLYFDFIQKIGAINETQILIIGGNHDSSQFLEAPAKILKRFNTHVIGQLRSSWSDHYFEFEKNNIKVGISALPYFRNYEIEAWIQNHQHDLLNQDDAIIKVLSDFNQLHGQLNQNTHFKLFMAHHVFMGFEHAGSEQSISLSGINTIPLQLYSNYDYLALGHIHKHQLIKQQKPTAIYPGSPLPFRFSESFEKNLIQIEVDENNWKYQKIAIPQWNKLYRIELNQDQYLQQIELFLTQLEKTDFEKWAEVKITLDNPESGLIDIIREKLVQKNVEILSFIPQLKGQQNINQTIEKLKDFSFEELFKEYYHERYGHHDIPAGLTEEFQRLLALAQIQTSEEL
jgi:DNA repair protein SbcD/Mre11